MSSTVEEYKDQYKAQLHLKRTHGTSDIGARVSWVWGAGVSYYKEGKTNLSYLASDLSAQGNSNSYQSMKW